MKKPNVSKMLKTVQQSVSKHSPEILTGLGIAGMITTTVLAVKATPKALMLMEDAEYDKGEPLTVGEKVKTTWKCYIPTVATCAVSTACLIGASSVNLKRNAALATAYQLSTTALSEYKEKVIETIGEKKENAIRDKIAKDKIDNHPVSTQEIIMTEKGNTLCYDATSGRYFKSDVDQIKRAINELNARMISEMYISLNEFYDELGMKPVSIGDEIGWNLHEDGLIEVNFSAQLSEEGEPCIVIDYGVAPRYDFCKLI